MSVLKVRGANGKWENIPAIKGDKGEAGDSAPHASRHAKGGADAISPESIGAASSGYGYGEMMTQISATSSSQSIEEFCQNFDAILDAMPTFPMTKQVGVSAPWAYGSGYYLATIYKYSAKYSIVVGYSSPLFASAYGWRIARDGSTWGEVEWITPPMKLNAEYRTTERINGKAVYKRNANGVIQYRLDGETEWKDYAKILGAYDHNHDERYYTKEEMLIKLANNQPWAYSTMDLEAGVDSLGQGRLYFVYE